MSSIKERVYACMADIENVLHQLEEAKKMSYKENIVLTGIMTYLTTIYTGMENILKELLMDIKISFPDTITYHKDLLNLAKEHNIISGETFERLGRYLYFRQFLLNMYSLLLNEEKIKPMVYNIFDTYKKFKEEIQMFLCDKNGTSVDNQ